MRSALYPGHDLFCLVLIANLIAKLEWLSLALLISAL